MLGVLFSTPGEEVWPGKAHFPRGLYSAGAENDRKKQDREEATLEHT